MIEGGCHCGAIRYQIDAELIDAGYCHCDICQQTTGAPVLAWATFPFDSFRYTEGDPVSYRSSDWGQREFCGTCGTQLCYHETKDPETIDINMGGLDEPEQFEPEYHVHVEDQLDWFEIDDDLPRYEGDGPDGDAEDDEDDDSPEGEGDDEATVPRDR